MAETILCPGCRKTLKAGAKHAGKVVRCPYCKAKVPVPPRQPREPSPKDAGSVPEAEAREGSGPQTPKAPFSAEPKEESSFPGLQVEGTSPPGTPPPPGTPSVAARRVGRAGAKSRPRGAGGGAAGTDVPLLLSGGLAAALTVVFYVVVVWPLKSTYFGALFAARGWVPYVIALLAWWSAAILVLKARKIARQRDSLLLDVLPHELAREIRPQEAARFLAHLDKLPGNWRASFFVNRVARALEHFLARKSAQEAAALLNSQAEIDAGAVQSSYTMVKVYIWAIPILGFIGTVLGIGAAVGGFSEAIQGAQELDVIKTSLTSVTAGLALAFDTTLIALVISIAVMLPASWMQKREEDLLSSVDDYCNETLLPRLNDGRYETPSNARELKEAMAEALARQDSQFQLWTERLETAGETLTQTVADGWRGVHERLQRSEEDRVRQIFESAAAEREALAGQIKATQQEQLQRADEVVKALDQTAGRIHREIAQFEESQVRKLLDAVGKLTSDREGLRRQAEQQLAAVSELGRELAGSLSESQLKLAERLAAISALLEGQKALANIQESLAANLTLLKDSEVYQRTLTTLEQLRPVLERLGIREDGQIVVARPARSWWRFWRR